MKIQVDGKAREDGSYSSVTIASLTTPNLEISLRAIDLLTIGFIALFAFLPRLLLAQQLDVVTDEVVYILGGKITFSLLSHAQIGAPGWNYNYEHPPLVKLLIGFSIYVNARLGSPLSELLAARLPGCIIGTLLPLAVYHLGKLSFGRLSTGLAALSLAASPWLTYFSALAYLDMIMTTLITLAYLLLLPAIRRPWLYLLIALLVGMAGASKYTAVLALPGMIMFTLSYFLIVRARLPLTQQSPVPWRWWLGAICLAPLTFLVCDPAIWPHPPRLLLHSFQYEWSHAQQGHLTFIAGYANLHAPPWATLYILFVKNSLLITLPALFFIICAFIQLLRFYRSPACVPAHTIAHCSLLLSWLLTLFATFSLLTIIVGTHYLLPLAPPVALAGSTSITMLIRFYLRHRQLFKINSHWILLSLHSHWKSALITLLLAITFVMPHTVGLYTTHAAEGYTSELFQGENTTLQVAYPGYREAVQWLSSHTEKRVHIGLVGLENALGTSNGGISWYRYNGKFSTRLQLTEVQPDHYNLSYDYLVWPMHLVQRGYTMPLGKGYSTIHTITGGHTTYCSILVRTADPP
jgi:4-amino-4-deoxy-L-arabinose transferase-like glycosyltransferase